MTEQTAQVGLGDYIAVYDAAGGAVSGGVISTLRFTSGSEMVLRAWYADRGVACPERRYAIELPPPKGRIVVISPAGGGQHYRLDHRSPRPVVRSLRDVGRQPDPWQLKTAYPIADDLNIVPAVAAMEAQQQAEKVKHEREMAADEKLEGVFVFTDLHGVMHQIPEGTGKAELVAMARAWNAAPPPTQLARPKTDRNEEILEQRRKASESKFRRDVAELGEAGWSSPFYTGKVIDLPAAARAEHTAVDQKDHMAWRDARDEYVMALTPEEADAAKARMLEHVTFAAPFDPPPPAVVRQRGGSDRRAVSRSAAGGFAWSVLLMCWYAAHHETGMLYASLVMAILTFSLAVITRRKGS